MKNLSFIIVLFILCTPEVGAQSKYPYPPLKKETIDLSALVEQYNGVMDIHYIHYKIATTMPENVLTDIDDQYTIKNFDLEKITDSQVEATLRLLDSMNSRVVLRAPKSDENSNFIYFEANLGRDQDSPIMAGKFEASVTFVDSTTYETNPIKNLNNISFYFHNRLKEKDGKPIFLGDKCIVSVYFNEEEDLIIRIAIELKDTKFEMISDGNISMTIKDLLTPKAVYISKKDLDKTLSIGNLSIRIVEFKNGVIHYQYSDEYIKNVENLKIIGVLKGKKFYIQNLSIDLSSFSYEKYRKKPNLDYPQFMEFIKPSNRNNITEESLKTKIGVINIGYNVDSIILINTQNSIPTNFIYNSSIRKENDSKQTISTIHRSFNFIENRKEIEELGKKIKKYIASRVKFPMFQIGSMDDVVTARILFKITASGELQDLIFLNRINASFKEEIESAFKNAPKFDPPVGDQYDYPATIRLSIRFAQ